MGLSEDFFFDNSRALTVNETPMMRYMHIDECGNLFSVSSTSKPSENSTSTDWQMLGETHTLNWYSVVDVHKDRMIYFSEHMAQFQLPVHLLACFNLSLKRR